MFSSALTVVNVAFALWVLFSHSAQIYAFIAPVVAGVYSLLPSRAFYEILCSFLGSYWFLTWSLCVALVVAFLLVAYLIWVYFNHAVAAVDDKIKRSYIGRIIDFVSPIAASAPVVAASNASSRFLAFTRTNLYQLIGSSGWVLVVAFVAARVRTAYRKHRASLRPQEAFAPRSMLSSIMDTIMIGFAGLGTIAGVKTVFQDVRNMKFVTDIMEHLFGAVMAPAAPPADDLALDRAFYKYEICWAKKSWWRSFKSKNFVEELTAVLEALRHQNVPAFGAAAINNVDIFGIPTTVDANKIGWQRTPTSPRRIAQRISEMLLGVGEMNEATFRRTVTAYCNTVRNTIFGENAALGAQLPDVHVEKSLYEKVFDMVEANPNTVKYATIVTVASIFAYQVVVKSGIFSSDDDDVDIDMSIVRDIPPRRRLRRVPERRETANVVDFDNDDDYWRGRRKYRHAAAHGYHDLANVYNDMLDQAYDDDDDAAAYARSILNTTFSDGKRWADFENDPQSSRFASIYALTDHRYIKRMQDAYHRIAEDVRGTWNHLTFESSVDLHAFDLDLDIPRAAEDEAEIKDACVIPEKSDRVYTVESFGKSGTCFAITCDGERVLLTASHCLDPQGRGIVTAEGESVPCRTVWRKGDLSALIPDGVSKTQNAWFNSLKVWKLAKSVPMLSTAVGVENVKYKSYGVLGNRGANVAGTQQYHYTCSTVPGDSGSPVFVATREHSLAVFGVHTNAGEKDKTNVFTSFVEFAKEIGQSVRSFRTSRAAAPKPAVVSAPAAGGLEPSSSAAAPSQH